MKSSTEREFVTWMMPSLEINIPVMAIVTLQKGIRKGDLAAAHAGTGVWEGQMCSFLRCGL